MTRSLDSALETAIAAGSLIPVFLAEIETASGFVRAFNGLGDLAWDGKVFTGTGEFGTVSTAEETADVRATGVTFTLSGVPADLVSTSLQSMRQGLPARLWLAAGNINGQLAGTPYLFFKGLTDVPALERGGASAALSITVENRLIDLERPRIRRYTPEDQRIEHSADKGFDYVASLQDAQFVWGRG